MYKIAWENQIWPRCDKDADCFVRFKNVIVLGKCTCRQWVFVKTGARDRRRINGPRPFVQQRFLIRIHISFWCCWMDGWCGFVHIGNCTVVGFGVNQLEEAWLFTLLPCNARAQNSQWFAWKLRVNTRQHWSICCDCMHLFQWGSLKEHVSSTWTPLSSGLPCTLGWGMVEMGTQVTSRQ